MTDKNLYTRRLSSSERLYLAGKDLFPSFCIQLLLESKDHIEIHRLRNAINIASEIHPSSRLILKGKRHKSYWIDSGINPEVIELQNPDHNEEDFDFEAIDFFSEEIDYINGPTSRVCIIHGQINRIVFQVFHGTMDAQGALLWAKDIFRILQDKEPIGAQSNLSDQEYLSTVKKKESRENYPLDCPSFLAQEPGTKEGFVWSRVVINDRINGIVSKLAKAIAEELPDQKNRFMIPVDIRRHYPKEQIGGNFSNPLFFEVSKEDSWEIIYEKMVRSLAKNEELISGKADGLMNYLPLWLLKKVFNTIFKKEVSKNKFMLTSVISNIGRIEKEWFSYNGYQPDLISFLPVNIPIAAMSFVITENEEQTVLTATAPASMTNKKYLDTTLSNLVAKVTTTISEDQHTETNPIKGDTKLITDKKDVLSLITNKCTTSPHSIAVSDEKERITYQTLAQRSDAIAKEICRIIDPNEAIIAVKMNRSIECVCSILAIIKVGGVFLPIDPDYPKTRVDYILDDANAQLILTDIASDSYNDTLEIDINTIDYNNFEAFDIPSSASELAYIIYTSGSTGKPKGVKVSHSNFMNYIDWAKNEYANNQQINFPFFTSISFDLTITSIFLPLVTGGMIKVYAETFQNELLNRILKDEELTAIKLTPTHLRVLKVSGITQSTIDTIIVGGEDLSLSISQDIDTQFNSQICIYNEYGPTEATVGCIVHKFDANNDTTTSVPIGLPITNTDVYILDDSQKIVTGGAIGELYIAGKSVAMGYINKPDMTHQKFIKNPFNKKEMLYKTGDLARLLSDGTILYKGRTDDQVKVRGHRIELAEIEHYICNHPKVQQGLATIINAASDTTKMVVGYYVGNTLSENELTEYLAKSLPKFMIPSRLFSLEQIPLNSNGKVDKKQLPKPTDFYTVKDTDQEIFSDLELKIRETFAEILEIDKKHINRDSDFYSIGGDSLGVTILVSTIMSDLIPTARHEEWLENTHQLIKKPTVEKISKMVQKIIDKQK